MQALGKDGRKKRYQDNSEGQWQPIWALTLFVSACLESGASCFEHARKWWDQAVVRLVEELRCRSKTHLILEEPYESRIRLQQLWCWASHGSCVRGAMHSSFWIHFCFPNHGQALRSMRSALLLLICGSVSVQSAGLRPSILMIGKTGSILDEKSAAGSWCFLLSQQWLGAQTVSSHKHLRDTDSLRRLGLLRDQVLLPGLWLTLFAIRMVNDSEKRPSFSVFGCSREAPWSADFLPRQ